MTDKLFGWLDEGWNEVVVGDKIVFAKVEYDEGTENPLDECDAMGSIHSFNRRHMNSVTPDPQDFEKEFCPKCGEELYDYNLGAVNFCGFCGWNDPEWGDREEKLDALWEQYDNGELDTEPEAPDYTEGLKKIVRLTDNVALSYFEHGNCLWGVAGTMGNMPDFMWDGTSMAGYWEPDKYLLEQLTDEGLDAPDKERERRERLEEWAKQACEVYTSWCNGEVYWYQVEVYWYDEELEGRDDYEHRGEPIDSDSCGGYYGHSEVKDAINNSAQALLNASQDEVRPQEEPEAANGEPGICPKCEAEIDTGYTDHGLEGEMYYYNYKCPSCGHEGTEEFELRFICNS